MPRPMRNLAEHGWGASDVPDPTAPATFEEAQLDWSEIDREPHAWLLGVHRELIALRRAHPDLTDPHLDRVQVDADADARTLVVHRGDLRLAVNLGEAPATLPVAARASDRAVRAPSSWPAAPASRAPG